MVAMRTLKCRLLLAITLVMYTTEKWDCQLCFSFGVVFMFAIAAHPRCEQIDRAIAERTGKRELLGVLQSVFTLVSGEISNRCECD